VGSVALVWVIWLRTLVGSLVVTRSGVLVTSMVARLRVLVRSLVA
jgi:hypothetical protein